MRTGISITTFTIYASLAAGCAGLASDHEATTAQFELTTCSSPDFYPWAPTMAQIVPEKELIIRDLSVVQDPCRSAWTGSPSTCGSTLGKWTFGKLMASLAGKTNVDDPAARQFAANWLASWLTPQALGRDVSPPVAVRANIWPRMLRNWLSTSGCSIPADTVTDPAQRAAAVRGCTTLNLKTAPFRLLAVVNRIDMDGRSYDGTGGTPGELRFAFGGFGAFDTTTPTSSPINATVIFEYQYPAMNFPPSWWASVFHGLSTVPFGASFSSQLQGLTDQVVETNAWPTKVNGSALGQLRTNENAFDTRGPSARQWEFRQFALGGCPSGTGICLNQAPVSQTPSNSLNNTQELTDYLTMNKDAAVTSTHVVPSTMLGGSSLSDRGPTALVWNTILDVDTGYHKLIDSSPGHVLPSLQARHGFAFATCNGCHYQETLNQLQQFHIGPREVDQVAPLSGFLTRTLQPSTVNANQPLDYLPVNDPNLDSQDLNGGIILYFNYNEIWRRACEMRRVYSDIQNPFTTAIGHH